MNPNMNQNPTKPLELAGEPELADTGDSDRIAKLEGALKSLVAQTSAANQAVTDKINELLQYLEDIKPQEAIDGKQGEADEPMDVRDITVDGLIVHNTPVGSVVVADEADADEAVLGETLALCHNETYSPNPVAPIIAPVGQDVTPAPPTTADVWVTGWMYTDASGELNPWMYIDVSALEDKIGGVDEAFEVLTRATDDGTTFTLYKRTLTYVKGRLSTKSEESTALTITWVAAACPAT